jgi:RNA polymerase sigma factor (sigma-70 family)
LVWGFNKKKTKAIHAAKSEDAILLPENGAAATRQGIPQERPALAAEQHRHYSDTLTKRERDVFDLLIQGKTMKEIANELGVKYSTVNTHQKNAYKKLGLHSRTECILRYGISQDRKEE